MGKNRLICGFWVFGGQEDERLAIKGVSLEKTKAILEYNEGFDYVFQSVLNFLSPKIKTEKFKRYTSFFQQNSGMAYQEVDLDLNGAVELFTSCLDNLEEFLKERNLIFFFQLHLESFVQDVLQDKECLTLKVWDIHIGFHPKKFCGEPLERMSRVDEWKNPYCLKTSISIHDGYAGRPKSWNKPLKYPSQ